MALDLSGIKSAFKTILDSANTTTADYDLSQGLNRRVQRILKVNPAKIPVDADLYPYVTIYADRKPVTLDTIARDQLTSKRMTELSFQVIGGVWEINTPDINEDEADEQIEVLMENVEEVIRRNFRLNNTVLWTKPIEVTYHTGLIPDEEAHLRIGVMNLVARIQY